MKKKKTRREIYLLAIILLIAVLILTFLPSIFDSTRVIFNPTFITVLHGVLSLLVAVITFGIIGDSDALVKSDNVYGFQVQICGSGAGFGIFFYLLTSALSPYNSLSLSLVEAGNGLLKDKVRVTLSGKTLQFGETSTGFLTFSFLPKEDDARRVTIVSEAGRSWRIGKIDPENCKVDVQKIRGDCDSIEITLESNVICLEEQKIISSESKEIETTLEIVLRRLKENYQKISPDLNANLIFSSSILKTGLHKEKFKLNRKIDSPRNICEHLSSIEGWFNRSRDRRVVRSYVSCNTILIAKSDEDISEEFKSCTAIK